MKFKTIILLVVTSMSLQLTASSELSGFSQVIIKNLNARKNYNSIKEDFIEREKLEFIYGDNFGKDREKFFNFLPSNFKAKSESIVIRSANDWDRCVKYLDNKNYKLRYVQISRVDPVDIKPKKGKFCFLEKMQLVVSVTGNESKRAGKFYTFKLLIYGTSGNVQIAVLE